MDKNGIIVNETYLTPFGEVALESETVRNNFRFPGQYHDRESMLYYNWNRYYIPSVGRYNTVDPLINTEDNVYAYSLNNPLSLYDEIGLKRVLIYGRVLLNIERVYIPSSKLRLFISGISSEHINKMVGIYLKENTWLIYHIEFDYNEKTYEICYCEASFVFQPCIEVNLKFPYPNIDICEVRGDCRNINFKTKSVDVHFIKDFTINF